VVDLAVVIVTYNSERVIHSLLDSLPAAWGGLNVDIVVVDNGSTDQTREVVEARSDCRLLRYRNVGYAGGINAGVRFAAPASAVLILNPDVVLLPDSISPLLARLAQPGVGIVVPRILNSDGTLHTSLRREPSLLRALGLGGTARPALAEYVTELSSYDRAGPVDWALGAVMVVSRTCLDALGGWDASYFLYSEETDFCLRARDLGWETWYEPRAVATHVGGASGRSDRTHVMQIVNRVRLYCRRHGQLASVGYLVLTMLSEVSWILRGHVESRAALRALVLPSRRPAELNCGPSLLPR
jgi:N-acetylglucosaminyl-diphospho-decaprenol L-rhamnosyltransferase